MAKGHKTGGRTKGTPNKLTSEIRDRFKDILSDNLEQFQNDLNDLEPKERLKILIELTKFVLPTLKATDLHVNEDVIIDFSEVSVNLIEP